MIYTLTVTTPNTQEKTSPLNTILPVTRGLIYRVEVEFRPGASGTLHAQIFDGGYQAWPSSRGESFNSDGFTIAFDDTYLKLIPPYEFIVSTWCENASYQHEIQVRLGIVSQEMFMARFLPTIGYKELTRVIQEAYTQQQEEVEKQRLETLKKPLSWVTSGEEL